jgi:hypothetical protein
MCASPAHTSLLLLSLCFDYVEVSLTRPPKMTKLGSIVCAASGVAIGDISFGGKDGGVADAGGGVPRDVSLGRIGQV